MRKLLTAALLPILVLLLLGGCGGQTGQSGNTGAGPGSAGAAGTAASVPPDTAVSDGVSAAPGSASLPPETAPIPSSPAPAAEPTPTPAPYLFGTPVEESEEVDGSEWFADAVFVGDSRTEGLQIYSGIRSADFLWHRGLSVFKATDGDYRVFEVEGEQLDLMGALAKKQYGKVYLMIGTNELGYKDTVYEKGLSDLLEQICAVQPNAVIYLQTLPPVNERIAREKGLGEYIRNDNVNAFNQAIVRQAREHRAALLDVASVFRSENGELPEDMAADGVHFYKDGYKLWAEYLRRHTLDPDAYANGQAAEELWSPLPPVPSPEPAEEPEPTDGPAEEPTEEPVPGDGPGAEEPSVPPETLQPDDGAGPGSGEETKERDI